MKRIIVLITLIAFAFTECGISYAMEPVRRWSKLRQMQLIDRAAAAAANNTGKPVLPAYAIQGTRLANTSQGDYQTMEAIKKGDWQAVSILLQGNADPSKRLKAINTFITVLNAHDPEDTRNDKRLRESAGAAWVVLLKAFIGSDLNFVTMDEKEITTLVAQLFNDATIKVITGGSNQITRYCNLGMRDALFNIMLGVDDLSFADLRQCLGLYLKQGQGGISITEFKSYAEMHEYMRQNYIIEHPDFEGLEVFSVNIIDSQTTVIFRLYILMSSIVEYTRIYYRQCLDSHHNEPTPENKIRLVRSSYILACLIIGDKPAGEEETEVLTQISAALDTLDDAYSVTYRMFQEDVCIGNKDAVLKFMENIYRTTRRIRYTLLRTNLDQGSLRNYVEVTIEYLRNCLRTVLEADDEPTRKDSLDKFANVHRNLLALRKYSLGKELTEEEAKGVIDERLKFRLLNGEAKNNPYLVFTVHSLMAKIGEDEGLAGSAIRKRHVAAIKRMARQNPKLIEVIREVIGLNLDVVAPPPSSAAATGVGEQGSDTDTLVKERIARFVRPESVSPEERRERLRQELRRNREEKEIRAIFSNELSLDAEISDGIRNKLAMASLVAQAVQQSETKATSAGITARNPDAPDALEEGLRTLAESI